MGGKHHHGAGGGSAGGGNGGGGGSLNSSMCNSVLTNATTATSSSLTQQQQQLQAKYIKSKRHQSRYTNLQHSGHDSGSYLHLNSLWSIWYGVLLTLFQGYLAMHGAYRFLGCSLIPWKIEPVAELNLQIVLSGVVFILLPVFFTSAVFKVGNLANDGIKLATGARERRCTLAPHDGLEEETRGGTLRALWTHGGPTAAFVHILIALCLLLPRLLLEARIIENGLLPKEQIWATEMDFVVINRRNLMALSVVGPTALPKHYHQQEQEQEQEQHPQQTLNMTTANGVSLEDEEDYYNDTMFTAMRGGMGAGNNNLFELRPQAEGRQKASAKTTTTTSKATTKYKKFNAGKYFEVPDLINQDIDEEERQELEEAIHGDEDNNEDEEEIGVLDEDEEPEQGTVILPDFDEFLTKTTTTTSSGSASASASEDSNKLSIENWQTLGTLGKGRSTTTEEPTTSSTTTTTSSTTTTPATTTTTRATTKATTTRGAAIATASKQPQHHHHSKTRKHHKQHHKKQQQPPRRHHVASHEQAMLEREAVQEETTTRDSNIHRVRPEVLPEIIIPSTPVSSNSKIIAIKPKNQKRRISKRSAGVEIEPEYQLGDGAGSISSSEFVAKSNEEDTEESEDFDLEEGDFQSVPALTPATPAPTLPGNDYVRLDGFAGMLQLFFGIDKPIDVAIFAQPPSAEFVNLLCALLVWSVRYPAVFWNTSKSFACVFSLQMIVAALDIILGYVGVSNLYKLQIYAEAMPVHQPGLILNAIVTLALYLLATALVLASSMVMYLYGHGRLATRMRDRSIITLKANETWIYFAHCASLCFVLALAVVKAPLLNDLSATYKNNLHCPTFLAALIGVTHLLLWIVVWLCLTIKRRWHFKLPPMDNTYGGLLNKASAQPLLMSSGQRTGSNSSSGGNSTSTTMNGGNDSSSKPDMMSTATSTELGMGMGMGLAAQEDIYWPKLTPSSPKLKVTFNEVTSTSDDVLLIGDQEQTDGKRHTSRGASICFASAAGEIDDGEYATLRAATAGAVVGITMGSMKSGLGLGAAGACVGSAGGGSISSSSVGVSLLHLSEYDELPPPPPTNHQQQQQQQQRQQQQHHQHPHPQFAHGHPHDYANLSGLGGISDDNISEEGKLLACVRDDSITYASTRDLEPPQPTAAPPPPPPLPVKGAPMPQPPALQPHHGPFGRAPQAMPEIMQLSPEHHQKSHLQQHLQQPLQPQKPLPPPHHPLQQQQQQGNQMHLVSPLAPVTVAVHTNEAHIASSSTSRCLRRADSGVPNEALTPRSDTTSITESTTTSPPERAPSESSSGVHSGEERELEVIIRPRASCKPPPRPPQPPIQEEPYGRCTNMRMSSFNADPAASLNTATGMNSATLPMQRTAPEQKFDYTAHCSTMPLPVGCHSQQLAGNTANGGYASTSAMTTSMGGGIPPPPSQVTSFKTSGIGIHYANAAVALGNGQAMQAPHTTLPNGVRYSNPHFLRRLPHMTKAAESPYGHLGYGAGHHAFAKLPHETHPTIPEDRDSANYSMASDQDCGLYVTAQLH